MKKGEKKSGLSLTLKIILVVVITLFVLFIGLPLLFITIVAVGSSSSSGIGNVAIIPVEGVILGSGSSGFGQQIASSSTIVPFIEDAAEDRSIEAIIIEINSPGGSAVASDEIAAAIKKVDKPVIALIRETGASGGYWIASSADHIIAHRMSITGSIGVISSYLEFSGLMEDYGVGYERLVSGENKDLGVPFKKLSSSQRNLLQEKIDKIHDYFVQEVANNRGLGLAKVQDAATGEFYLGVEALELGLVDELGNQDTVEEYLTAQYGIQDFNYVEYRRQAGLFDLFAGVTGSFFFNMGQGLADGLVKSEQPLLLS